MLVTRRAPTTRPPLLPNFLSLTIFSHEAPPLCERQQGETSRSLGSHSELEFEQQRYPQLALRPILPLPHAMSAQRTDRRPPRTWPWQSSRQTPTHPPRSSPSTVPWESCSSTAASSSTRQASATPATTQSVQSGQPRAWNEQETALIRAGYQPAYDPPATPAATETGDPKRKRKRKTVRFDMAEPRARAARHKGQMNFGPESMSLLLSSMTNHPRGKDKLI